MRCGGGNWTLIEACVAALDAALVAALETAADADPAPALVLAGELFGGAARGQGLRAASLGLPQPGK